jgi:hypothetical protein
MSLQPTQYPDVNSVLHDFLTGAQAILDAHFVGMYLYGSLALGDFNPEASDIDFIVVTGAELSDALFEALRLLHVRFDASGSPWAAKIEAAYIPRDVLHRDTPSTARYPQVEKGTTLVRDPLESGWSFQRLTLREHGVVVAGPDPRELIAAVDPAAMRRDALAITETWLHQARHDPDWLAWLRDRRSQAFVVLTLCRLLYSLDRGAVASKPAAARWARQALGRRWAALVDRSLAAQHASGVAPEQDVTGTVALIAYTVERYRHYDCDSDPPLEP